MKHSEIIHKVAETIFYDYVQTDEYTMAARPIDLMDYALEQNMDRKMADSFSESNFNRERFGFISGFEKALEMMEDAGC